MSIAPRAGCMKRTSGSGVKLKRVFDIHAHIYPDAIASHAVRAISEAYDGVPIQNDGRLDTLISKLDEAEIRAAAIHSVATTPHHAESINRYILGVAQAHPRRFVPFASLHPDMPDLEAAVEDVVEKGFAGVKLHPECQRFLVDEPRAIRLLGLLAGRLPVLMHCGDMHLDNSAPERVLRMLDKVPDLTLICAHLGGWTSWEKSSRALIGSGVYADCSSSLFALDGETAVRILRGYGVDHVFFGSDYPAWTPGEELERFFRLPLDGDEREQILWDNAKRMFANALPLADGGQT